MNPNFQTGWRYRRTCLPPKIPNNELEAFFPPLLLGIISVAMRICFFDQQKIFQGLLHFFNAKYHCLWQYYPHYIWCYSPMDISDGLKKIVFCSNTCKTKEKGKAKTPLSFFLSFFLLHALDKDTRFLNPSLLYTQLLSNVYKCV